MQKTKLESRGKTLSMKKPLIMGVLNVTPDSFSDGGLYLKPEDAAKRALEMVKQGADIIDIGGESSGPNSNDVKTEDELKRILPVLKLLFDKTPAWLSVDTHKAEVAKQALDMGADMINDVTALRGDPKMAEILAKYEVPVILMYSKDSTARTTTDAKDYSDVVETVRDFLMERIEHGVANGVAKKWFIVDPGMGAFVSSKAEYSLQILKRLQEFELLELPILVGASRKSFIGETLDLPMSERLEGSLAAAAVAVMNGASIIRVHDVKETRRVVDMVDAIMKS